MVSIYHAKRANDQRMTETKTTEFESKTKIKAILFSLKTGLKTKNAVLGPHH